ncbi:MAG: biotin/lipoyl-binding protein [Roseibium sp.]|uniref:efflux RND transporter periplasmic adaptor subunit n=1 Tax=Roseibium sp. TaxID=1936156 RepID=UPI00261A12E2|nr:biotin/lipoyl-binding protein [Roseibium sp.]MCV0424628.1 biotin/lipoyl-binding protein [Roseibium sp.]
MSLLRKALIIPPIAVGAALLFYAVSGREAPKRSEIEETATVVRVVTSTPQSFVPRVIGYGTVEPSRTLDAIAQVSGRVTFINPNFKRGDFVSNGDILVTLSPEDYELEIAEAETDIASANVDLEELDVTLTTQKKSLEISKAVLDLEERELARLKTLLQRKVISDQQVENQEAAVLQQRTVVQDLENEIALNPVKRKALEQAKRKNEVRLETAQLNLSRTTIKAPFDARVASVGIEIDQFVAAGTSIGELDGVDAADIDVQISPTNMSGFANLVFAGQLETEEGVQDALSQLDRLDAVVKVGSAGNSATWDARVKRISDTVDPDTRSVGLIVSVDKPYDTLRPAVKPPLVKGMFAEVELSAQALPEQTVLPRNAVLNGKIMTVSDDQRLQLRDVYIAYRFADIVVLKKPLSEGTRVVISDVSPVIENMLLSPVEDESAGHSLTLASGHSSEAGDSQK